VENRPFPIQNTHFLVIFGDTNKHLHPSLRGTDHLYPHSFAKVHLFGRGCLPAYFDGEGSFLNRLSRVSSQKQFPSGEGIEVPSLLHHRPSLLLRLSCVVQDTPSLSFAIFFFLSCLPPLLKLMPSNLFCLRSAPLC
jgi:hypothetical protein